VHARPPLTQQQVRIILEKELSGKSPRRSAGEILAAEKKRHRGKGFLPIIAAAACLALLCASLTVPALARAFAQVPIIGDAYLDFIQGSGLDIAYQAGFVNELGRKVEKHGITLTVLGAYADSTETSVMFTLTSEDKDLIRQVWDGTYAPWTKGQGEKLSLHPWLKGAGTGSSTMQIDEGEGVIYGLVSVESRRLLDFGRKESLVITAGAYGEPVWQISFPVQTVPRKYIETVPVNKTITYRELQITLEEIIFSPGQTVLAYTTKGPQGAGQMCHWAVKTPGGELIPLGGSYGSHGLGFSHKGVSRFSPTQERDLTVYFQGQNEFFATDLRLPLQIGSKAGTEEGIFSVTGIAQAESTRVTLTWTGESQVRKVSAVLRNPATGSELPLEDFSAGEDNIELVFSAVGPEVQWLLHIDGVLLENREEIEVFQMP
jgi:hypothetical protein